MSFNDGLKKFGKKSWDYIKLARIELLILAGILILDLVSKAIIQGAMYEGQSITLIPNFLYITFVHNDKAAFSWDFGLSKAIGIEGTRIVFLIITVLAVGVFAYFMYRFRGRHIVARVSFALIISGALGNFFDRLFLKYVRDFIEFRYFGLKILGSYSFPVFNFADAALTVGVVLFLVFYLFLYKDPKKEEEEKVKAAQAESVADGEKTTADEEPNAADKPAPAVVPMIDAFDDGDAPVAAASEPGEDGVKPPAGEDSHAG